MYETAVTLPCRDFYYEVVRKNYDPFVQLHPLQVWERMFLARAKPAPKWLNEA